MRRIGLAVILAIGLFSAPLATEGQQAAKVQRVGYLGYDAPGSDPTGISGLRQGLRDLGYIENQNIVIEYRFAEGQPDRLPGLISELTNLKVGVLITQVRWSLPPPKERRRQCPSSPCRATRSAPRREHHRRPSGVAQTWRATFYTTGMEHCPSYLAMMRIWPRISPPGERVE
jgi:hypothetical protein